jgi:hypothetical protein
MSASLYKYVMKFQQANQHFLVIQIDAGSPIQARLLVNGGSKSNVSIDAGGFY